MRGSTYFTTRLASTAMLAAALLTSGCDPNGCSCGGAPESAAPAKEADVKLDVVKFDQLESNIKALKGKVVVMDVWGTFCVPCKKEFPRLVKLHQGHEKDGLACVSVSVDDPTDPKAKEDALAFLKSKEATFTNYLLDEKVEVWTKKWGLEGGVPAVFVYDRDGKLVKKFEGDDSGKPLYEGVEKLVAELLRQK